jgi:hypothetical protein
VQCSKNQLLHLRVLVRPSHHQLTSRGEWWVAAVVAVVVVVVLLESMSVVDCAVTNASASANKLPNKRLIVQKIDSFQIDLILNFDYRFYFDCRLLLIVVFGFCAYLLLRFD